MTDTYGTALATLDPETLKRPTSRIGNAGNARTLVRRLKFEDETRMWRDTKVQGLLDGNPPWSQQTLRDIGQGHRANFNLREGEGIVDSAKTPYYDLVFEVPNFAQITFDIPGAEDYTLQEWGNGITEEYTDVMSDWIGFDQNVQLSQWEMIVRGNGPVFWPHSISWKSESLKSRKVLVPQETKANVEQLEIVVVLHSWRADELEGYIAGAKDTDIDYNGWNVPLCKQAIVTSAIRDTRNAVGMENYELYQRAIRTGDIYYGIHRSNRIFVASLFTREFGGKVSHYIITDSPQPDEGKEYEKLDDEVGYIYKKKGKYDGFEQVVCPFFFDTGPDGTWHSIKGLGPKAYDFCDVSNRTFCQMLDGSVIGSGIVLEAQDPNAMEETQLALIGGATVVQPGYKVSQTRIAENLNGAMSMRRELQNTLQSNTGTYRQRVSEENEEPTLGQAQMNYQQQAVLSKGATNRYYNNLDKFHAETVRRLLDPAARQPNVPGSKEAKDFIMRCLARGIPEEVLDYKFIRRVRSVRSVGYGSPNLRDMATKELVGMIPLMDETGRNHALRMRAAALPGVGQAGVDSIFPKIEKQGVPNAHASFATMENNALRQPGGKALVEPQQNHSTHFDVHAKDAMDHVQDPNADPHEKLMHLEQAGPHMAEHLNKIKGDPTRKDEVKQKEQTLQTLSKESDRLAQNVQESNGAQPGAQPQPGNGQQPGGQDDAAMVKVVGDLSLKSKKQEGDMALKARGQSFKERLDDQKTAAEIMRKRAQPAQPAGGR